MKTLVIAGVAVLGLALAGCSGDGAVSDIASQAASAAASGVQDKANEAKDAVTGQVCEGLTAADESLASLAQGKAETVGQAKQQVADAQANLEQTAQEATGASKTVLTGVSTAIDALAQSLASLKDDSEVPESVTQATDDVESSIAQAQDSLGC